MLSSESDELHSEDYKYFARDLGEDSFKQDVQAMLAAGLMGWQCRLTLVTPKLCPDPGSVRRRLHLKTECITGM